MENTKKAVIYARQSSGSDDYSESIERQIENCKSLACKEGFEVIGIYSDLNTSGKTYPAGSDAIANMDNVFQKWFENQTGSKKFRIGLQQALDKLDAVDYVIVDDLTRLYRPVRGSFLENFVNEKFIANNVLLMQVKGGCIDFSKFDGCFISSIKGMVNDEQIANGKMKSKQQLKARRDAGFFANGGGKTFGTVYSKDTGKITIQQEYQPVIDFIYQAIADYMPTMQIVKQLNVQFGNMQAFYASNVYHIARNPLYCGYMRNTDGLLIENKQIINPCIPFAKWQEVQQIMDCRKTNVKRTKKRWLPLSGMMYCGYCGRRLSAICEKRSKHEKITYNCQQKYTLGTDCTGSNINVIMEKKDYSCGLLDAVKPLLVFAYLDMMDKEEENRKNAENFNAMQVQLDNLQTRKQKIADLIAKGLMDDADAFNALEAIKKEANTIKEKMLYCKTANPDDFTRHLDAIAKKFRAESFLTDELDHTLFESLLQASIKRINVFMEYIEVVSVYGTFNVPRMISKNHRNMPLPELIINGKEQFTCIIIYKTGKKAVLADFGRVKVLTR